MWSSQGFPSFTLVFLNLLCFQVFGKRAVKPGGLPCASESAAFPTHIAAIFSECSYGGYFLPLPLGGFLKKSTFLKKSASLLEANKW